MSRGVLLLLAAVSLLPAQVKLVRYPTYSQGKVAFSYLGDIWTANENGTDVHRLTDNLARDIYPRFSPDGKWIAFSSYREGNYDVFVIPATGGKPRQLTFHTADDNVVGWSADGQNVLFSSVRGMGAFPTVATLFEVSAAGGMERPLPVDWGASGSYSADGKKLAFMRHPSVWSRKHYRGSYAADLWLFDVPSAKYTKLSGQDDYKGNWLWPMYAKDEIFFVSDRTANEKGIRFGGPDVMKSVNNIWKISERGGMAVQVTHHNDGNLYYPSISADRKTIVYEDNFGIWKLDTATGKTAEIRIEIQSDAKESDTQVVTISDQAESFHLSPSSRRAAIVAHGQLFTIATERGEVQRVSDTPWRDQAPRWSPDGKWIAFVSDRSGREEVWISDELGKNTKKLSDVDCDKSSIEWSPDSKNLLWNGSDEKLRRVAVEGGATMVVASSDAGMIQSPQYSPDGKWISYVKPDRLLRSHVWIQELATGQEHMISSDQFQFASGARWTPDGKKLLLIGGVSVPGIATQGYRGTPSQLYAISLAHAAKPPQSQEFDTEAEAMAALAENGPGRGGRGPGMGAGMGPVPLQVTIEWDGIERRITKLTSLPTPVFAVAPAPDSRTYALLSGGIGTPGETDEAPSAGPAIYIIGEDGSHLTRLNTTVPMEGGRGGGRGRGGFGFGGGNEPQWSRDSRAIYFMTRGGIYSVSVPAAPAGDAASGAASPFAGRSGRSGRSGIVIAAAPAAETPGAGPRRVTFTLRLVFDREAERRQVFEEAWRVMKNRFYDPKMNGANWAAAKDKYESLLPHIADAEELHNVIMEMIGEINASHTGITGGGHLPGETAPEPLQTRYPGFTLEPDASGYYKVAQVYRRGPADRDYFKLAPGDFVLAVNGKQIKAGDNYWQLFNILPGRKFDFLVNSKPVAEGAWNIEIEPLTKIAEDNLEYAAWVERRKEMVDKLSGGEIGYLHIRAMDAPSLVKFEEDLADNRGKKALIIDQRFNGGGGIDQELLEILNQRKAYQQTRSRGSLEVPRPVHAFFGPMVVLQNERSASDAEMFPEGFRALKLGKLIGVPTMGAVIGTGAYTLLDGSQLRTPASGVYTEDGTNLENYGVQPDILVDNGPADFAAGHDRQIERAVEVLKSEPRP